MNTRLISDSSEVGRELVGTLGASTLRSVLPLVVAPAQALRLHRPFATFRTGLLAH